MKFKRTILIIALMGNFVTMGFAQMTPESASAKFTVANELYKKGSYAGAAKVYEAVRAGGYHSGALNFNLGNTYFKLGQLGKAILNYERARRILPRDADVLSNYRYALFSARTDI